MDKKVYEEETGLEKVSGNLGTNIAATLISAFSGNPVASLLPMLNNTLAGNRHKKRVEEAIRDVNLILESHSDSLNAINDAQYKLINETVLSIFQTIEQDKIDYLKAVVANSISESDIDDHESVLLSRIIRAISAEEIKFLIKNFRFEFIEIGGLYDDEATLFIEEDSRDELIVNGLSDVGIMSRASHVENSKKRLKFSDICSKLISLVK